MNPPARRDGTPDKKERVDEIIVSNAKPARHQHVSKKDRAATAQSVAAELGADWLYADEDSADSAAPAQQGERLQKVLAKAGVASVSYTHL